jgi:hypothetical protein
MERLYDTPPPANATGYTKSKFVAEQICESAAVSLPGVEVAVLRIGQLTGDTTHGIWNMTEAWPRMWSTTAVLGCLPDLEGVGGDWLPVDCTAKAVIELSLGQEDLGNVVARSLVLGEASSSDSIGRKTHSRGSDVSGTPSAKVFHVVASQVTAPSWSQMLKWISDYEESQGKRAFKIVTPEVWLDQLEDYDRDDPAKALVGLWRKAFLDDSGRERGQDSAQGNWASNGNSPPPQKNIEHQDGARIAAFDVFDTARAVQFSSAMGERRPVDKKLVIAIWTWLQEQLRDKNRADVRA